MIIEKSPLLSQFDWVEHGFLGRDNAVTNTTIGMVTDAPFTRFPVFYLPQCHSDIIVSPDDADIKSADASITTQAGIALAVKTADCIPLLLLCPKTKMIAAVHAGWQGALNMIAEKTVMRMADMGAKPSRMVAAFGPNIHERSFQVQDDVRDKFRAAQPDTIGFFKPFRDRWLMDVAGIVAHQLSRAGVRNMWHSPTNTFTSDKHHSFRKRDDDPSNETARNVSFIALKNTN